MKKNFFRKILLTSMVTASFSLVACGNKENSEEITTPIETTTNEVESTTNEDTSEEASTSEIESTTNEVETSTTEEVTVKVEELSTTIEEMTTIKVEVETTTKAPEPTTQAPTQAPTEATSVNDATTEKIKSLHIAIMPKECYKYVDYELSNQMGAIVGVGGEDYREPADYVDSNCSGSNPYTMHEWTTRKYWWDRDEVTIGYYGYEEDTKYGPNTFRQKMIDEIAKVYGHGDIDSDCIKIGTYEGKDIYFVYYFLKNKEVNIY